MDETDIVMAKETKRLIFVPRESPVPDWWERRVLEAMKMRKAVQFACNEARLKNFLLHSKR
jgi:3-polyprenyl-4-hydroxybenzoate decarboxylase